MSSILKIICCKLSLIALKETTNIVLGSVIFDTRHWLTMNFQKVNNGKTEMMVISSMHLPHVEFPQSLVGDEIIMPADSFRNLGVQFDCTYGDQAILIAAPKLWNALPNYIKLNVNFKVFKCHLKTHLFKESYI